MSPPEPEELEIFPCLLNQGAMLPGESQALLLPQFSAVAQSCLTLCNPMHCSMPGLPVHQQLQEFTQTRVHRVSDAVQPSHLCRPLLLPPSILPSIRWPKYWSFSFDISHSNEYSGLIYFRMD